MKTIITIMFTALLATSLSGQFKQQLDSIINEIYDAGIVWQNHSKYYHTYDADQREIEEIFTFDDPDTGQLTEYRAEYSYNSDNKIIQKILSERPYGIMQWTFEEKEDFIFDVNGNLVEHAYSYWNTNTMQWISLQKFEWIYNTDGYLIELIDSLWSPSLNQWGQSSIDDFTYDANGNLLTRIYSWWDGMQWLLEYKEASTYDTNGNLIFRIDSNWNSNTNQWVDEYNNEFTYDADNRLLSYISSVWNGSQWIGETRDDYTYDANGNISSFILSSWYDSQWNYDSKTEYDYDANGNQILLTDFSWDNYTMQWGNDWKTTCDYDNDYAYNELILPNYYTENYFRYKKLTYTDEIWDVYSQQWSPAYKGTYYYSSQLVSTQNIADTNVRIFPNPARDRVVFDLALISKPVQVKLYDAQGKLASVQALKDNTISVGHLEAGVYFYHLLHKGEPYRGRLLVR